MTINMNKTNNLDQISDDDSANILDKPLSCKKTTPKSQILYPQPHKKLRK
jgi:hypothetical protein